MLLLELLFLFFTDNSHFMVARIFQTRKNVIFIIATNRIFSLKKVPRQFIVCVRKRRIRNGIAPVIHLVLNSCDWQFKTFSNAGTAHSITRIILDAVICYYYFYDYSALN